MLLGDKRLQEVVMDNFLDPLPTDEWNKIKFVKNKEDFLRRKYNQQGAVSKSTGWRPLNYDSTIAQIYAKALVKKENKYTKHLLNAMLETMRGDEVNAQRYLSELFENLSDEKDLRMQQNRSLKINILNCRLDIEVEPVQRAAVSEAECAICRETLVDHEDIYESILKAASMRQKKHWDVATELFGADDESRDLDAAIEVIDERLPPLGALVFDKRLLNSYHELKKVMEEPKCVQAVKVRCGHIFGFDCLAAWLLDGHFTCPMCRAKLGGPAFAQQAYSSPSIDEIDDFLNGDFPEDSIVVDHPLGHAMHPLESWTRHTTHINHFNHFNHFNQFNHFNYASQLIFQEIHRQLSNMRPQLVDAIEGRQAAAEVPRTQFDQPLIRNENIDRDIPPIQSTPAAHPPFFQVDALGNDTPVASDRLLSRRSARQAAREERRRLSNMPLFRTNEIDEDMTPVEARPAAPERFSNITGDMAPGGPFARTRLERDQGWRWLENNGNIAPPSSPFSLRASRLRRNQRLNQRLGRARARNGADV